MDPLRYDTDVDTDANTSHALVVELVGTAKRVLDIGCATGAVGKVLVSRGCEVVGVEPEAAAAAVAELHLSEVLVGTMEDVDLESRFGSNPFDAIVVADVLEHLPSPLPALRRLVGLLAPGGSIVASLPNIAHGAVRLALLQGRFDYTDVGLLDRTHLQFFTRATVEKLFEDAALTIVDLRRTTAGVFDTEIPLDRAQIDPQILAAVQSDPEATTYQYVVRAVAHADAGATSASAGRLDGTASELERKVASLELAARAQAESLPNRGAQVGIWGYLDTRNPADAFRAMVHRHELGLRRPELDLRLFAPYSTRPSPLLEGILETLGEATVERATALAEELDAIVVVGELSARADEIGRRFGDAPAPLDHPAYHLIRAVTSNGGTPFLAYSAVSGVVEVSRGDDRQFLEALLAADAITTTSPALARVLKAESKHAEVVVDPLVLSPRLFDVMNLQRHLERDVPVLAGKRYVVIRGGRDALAALPRLASAFGALKEAEPDIAIVGLNADGGADEGRFTAALADQVADLHQVLEPSPMLVVALLAGATALATEPEWLQRIAEGFRIPNVSLLRAGTSPTFANRGVLVSLVRERRRLDGVRTDSLDRWYDELSRRLADHPIRPRRAAWPLLAQRLEATEEAHRHERAARAESEYSRDALVREVQSRERALADAEQRAARLQAIVLERPPPPQQRPRRTGLAGNVLDRMLPPRR